MSVRKVSNRGGNIIGRFPSLKLKCMVSFESLIERDFIYWLEFEAAVTWFREQPMTISYQYGQKRLNYTPDFHIIKHDHNILVECKPQKFVGTADNQRKFVAAQAWCVERGWSFQVVTDVDLQRSHRLGNIKRLTQFARYSIAPGLKDNIVAFLGNCPTAVTMIEVMQHIAPEQPQRMLIPLLTMAFHHELVLDLDEAPLSGQTLVKLVPSLQKGESK